MLLNYVSCYLMLAYQAKLAITKRTDYINADVANEFIPSLSKWAFFGNQAFSISPPNVLCFRQWITQFLPKRRAPTRPWGSRGWAPVAPGDRRRLRNYRRCRPCTLKASSETVKNVPKVDTRLKKRTVLGHLPCPTSIRTWPTTKLPLPPISHNSIACSRPMHYFTGLPNSSIKVPPAVSDDLELLFASTNCQMKSIL